MTQNSNFIIIQTGVNVNLTLRIQANRIAAQGEE